MSDNLHELLLAAQDSPGRPVLRSDDGSTWTMGDIDRLSRQIAAVLRRRGVQRGDRLAVQLEKTPEAVCLYLASLQIGAIYLPINTAYTAPEVAHIVSDAEPVLVVADKATALVGGNGRTGAITFHGPDGLLHSAAAIEPLSATEPVGELDPAAILYTSGTTGRPKGAVISHRALAFTARTLSGIWEIGSEDVLLHALPIFHAHGLFIALNTALYARAQVIFLPRFDVDSALNELPNATVFMGVPTFYSRLLADPRLDRARCAGMRLFTSGSAPLSADHFSEFENRTGHAILERYGMTETTIIASNPLKGDRIPATVGFPLPGVEVDLRDAESGTVPSGQVGELIVRGPNVFTEYWRMPTKTAEDLTEDGYFRTGDLATIDSDGRITLVGRAKDLIISGGYNVYAQEVETALGRIPGIQNCAVIGCPHPDFGEGVVAIVEPKPDGVTPSQDEIVERLGRELARYKLPKKIQFSDALPRNALGKVQKNVLRDTYRKTFA
ncbi:AMP-binding protein [Enterovirga aerilata]|uniref:AMP-binding protein n=1 Tax=Enterovirga aerilata TaxID=2730920 RepID=A0A849ICM2_9HYPH|nr:AMP-binding protein [Enterovirga sp. DB1703]NNM74169.1 AMP-binding protein [Enterovirga sp. DB1703]